MEIKSHMHGIMWFVVHIVFGAASSTLVRTLSADFHPFQIVFMHNLFALPILIPWALKGGGIRGLATTHPKSHILRGALSVVSFSFWVTAIAIIPLADAAALGQGVPLLTVLFAILFLKEPLNKHRLTALLIGFIGAIIVLRPGTSAFQFGSLLVLGAVIVRAGSDILSKNLLKIDSAKINTFYMFVGTTVFSFPLALIYWKTPEIKHLPMLFTMGIFAFTLTFAILKAFEREDLTVLMPFAFLHLILMFAAGYIFFNEHVDVYTLIGGIVIIASSIYTLKTRKRVEKEIIHDPGE